MSRSLIALAASLICLIPVALPAVAAQPGPPYISPAVQRQEVFEFAKKPSVRLVSKDRYEITFAAKGACDVAIGIIDEKGTVIRHLAAGVLGPNAPKPLQKGTLSQRWAASRCTWSRGTSVRYRPASRTAAGTAQATGR
jgi:hypothetical protein